MNFVEYYSQEGVIEKLLELGKNREVVGVYSDGSFSKRPNTLVYPADIEAMVKSGVVEFHSSIEIWSNPLKISNNYDDLRVGWDIILDLDCKKFEYSKIAAKVLCSVIKKHGINNFSLKFSGGTGFHLGIPWGSIPREINYKKTEKQFPDLPRKIAKYLKEYMREDFAKALSKQSPEELAKELDIPLGELVTKKGLDPFKVVDIDPVLISPRHLFRMAYSINSKTGLASLPIRPDNLADFQREDAKLEKIKPSLGFLDNYEENETELLITESLDWWNKFKKEEEKSKKTVEIKDAVKEDYFPPCVKLISNGLKDGKKRSVFILINFLSSAKWSWENIEKYLLEWNKKNNPSLRDSYIRGQIKYAAQKKTVPPPNCPETVKDGGSRGYYETFNVCHPDKICSKIKNPISYPYFAEKKEK